VENISSLLRRAVVGHERFPGKGADYGEALHVVFGVDGKYARGMGVAIASLLSNNPDMPMVFHIFGSSIPKKDMKRLSSLSASSGREINFYRVEKELFRGLPVLWRFSAAIYYRLIAPEWLEGTVGRYLYIDSDIICLGRLDELHGLDLEGHAAAAVSDLEDFVKKRSAELGLAGGRYFNSGVLYVDVDRWNREEISARAVEIAMNGLDDMVLPDQDSLNVALDGRVKYLERRWNLMYDMKSMAGNIPEDTVLLHYTAAIKPWKVYCRHPLKESFLRYAKMSPWKDVGPDYPRNNMEIMEYAVVLAGEKRAVASQYWYYRIYLQPLLERAQDACERFRRRLSRGFTRGG
jgi:lipopolysaccharide biosynthesis glycosyltransferase